MKRLTVLTLAALVVAQLVGCGGASSGAGAAPPPPQGVSGLSMPKSVSVVTAN